MVLVAVVGGALVLCAARVLAVADEQPASCIQQPDEALLLQTQGSLARQPINGHWEQVSAADFSKGTLRIRRPGKYVLKEDIVFSPQSKEMSWSRIPNDSKEYPQLGGYFLGFFAALTVEADNVELDCQDHELRMSSSFHKVQRFFALIELCSSPFKIGQGPPQFSSSLTTPEPPVCAKNVTIKNCRFGLTGHHAIHGNDNEGVHLQRLRMHDFEVAGVALNGASRTWLEGLDIGPSLKKTFSAPLSHAIFMDHLASTLMTQDAALSELRSTTRVTLRGSTHTVAQVLDGLRRDLQRFIHKSVGPLLPAFGNKSRLPDGSAIYGLLLFRSGVATQDFGAICPDNLDDADGSSIDELRVRDVRLDHIYIHDLSNKVDQVTQTFIDGRAVMGMAGDVFQVLKAWDPKSCFSYVGNSFWDSQIAVGKLRKAARVAGVPPDTISFYFGGSHIPQPILDWAGGGMSCKATTAWVQALSSGTGSSKFTCNVDAMAHINKGAVGMRLGFQADVRVHRVVIENIDNRGVANAAPYCVVEDGTYQGADVRGVALAHMKKLRRIDVEQKGRFNSTNELRVFPVTGLSEMQMRADEGDAEAFTQQEYVIKK